MTTLRLLPALTLAGFAAVQAPAAGAATGGSAPSALPAAASPAAAGTRVAAADAAPTAGEEKPLSSEQLDAFLQQYGKDGTLSIPQADTAAGARFDALDVKHTGKVDQKELIPAGVDAREFAAVNPDKDTTLEKDEYLNLVRRKFNAANAKRGEALTKAELGTPAGQSLMRLLR